MKYCYKCGTQLNDEMMFCHNCGEKIVIPNNTPVQEARNQYTPTTETKCDSNENNPRRRKAMGIVGMVLSYITLLFSIPLAIASGLRLNYGATTPFHSVLFVISFIPSLIMTTLSTIFSFVSRFQSGFKNQITSRGVMVSIINLGILFFSLVIYILVR